MKRKRRKSEKPKKESHFTKKGIMLQINIAIVIHRSILTCCHSHCRHCSFGTRFAAVAGPEAVAAAAVHSVVITDVVVAVASGSSVIVAAAVGDRFAAAAAESAAAVVFVKSSCEIHWPTFAVAAVGYCFALDAAVRS